MFNSYQIHIILPNGQIIKSLKKTYKYFQQSPPDSYSTYPSILKLFYSTILE